MKLRSLALALILTAFASAQDAKKPEQKAADPVCGMIVDKSTSPKSEYKGKTYYFCSLEDKKEFERSPASYIKVDKKETTKKQ